MHNKMKKAVALLMSIFMIGSALSAMNVKADNESTVNKINSEIINGDFEKDLDQWQILSNDKTAFSTEVFNDDMGKVLKVAPTVDGGSSEICATAWEVQPSTTYVISYDVKVDEYKGLVSFTKYEFKKDWSLINDGAVYNEGKIEATTEGWQKITYKFTTSEDTSIVQLRLLMNEGGVAYFDNVILTREVASENLVFNADFSSNADGWNADGGLGEYKEQVPTTKTTLYKNDFETTAFENAVHKEESGNKYMHYEMGNAESRPGINVNLVPGTEYKVSYKLRVNNINGNHSIAPSIQEYEPYDPLKTICAYETANTDGWKEVKGTFTATKEHATLFIVCYGDGDKNASFDIDDFEIYTETTNKKIVNLLSENFDNITDTPFLGSVLTEEAGNKFLKFKDISSDRQGNYSVALKKGAKYKISFDAKTFNGVGKEIYLWLTDWGEQYEDYRFLTEVPELTGEWKNYEFEFEAKRDGSNVVIFSKWNNQKSGEAEYGIDNLKVVEITNEAEDAVIIAEGYGKGVGHNGENGLVINSKADVWNWATGVNGKLVQGKTYTYGFWYKTVGTKEGFSFTPYVHNITDAPIVLGGGIGTDTDWTYVSGEFVAPAKHETEGIRIGFYRQGTGTVYFSGLTVMEKASVHIHHGHLDTVKEATCQEEGQKEYKCDECKEHIYYDGIAKTGHDYSVKVKTVESTYTEKGYTEYKCKHCDATEKRDWTDIKVKPAKPATPAPTTKVPETTKLKAPSQVKSVKLTAKKKSLKVTWKKVSGVKKYQVQLCTSRKFKKGIIKKNASKNSLTVKKLKARKKYYVRVRAIKTSGKQTVYGKWSKILNKKTK